MEGKEEMQMSGSEVTPTSHAEQRGEGDRMQVTATG